MSDSATQRDLVGYGRRRPQADWPGGARLAVSFVLNYEEGAELSTLYGDPVSEVLNAETLPHAPRIGARDRSMESFYEYGSRVGFWRVFDLFRDRDVPVTIYAVGFALKQNPDVAREIAAAGCDVVGHGWRWIDYHNTPESIEREHISLTVRVIEDLVGRRPVGWYTGRPSAATRRLVVEHGGFLYDCDAFNDDLPYWTRVNGQPHLIVPYANDTNDNRLARGEGLETGGDYFDYLRDSFDWLHAEGAKVPAMMSVGLHARLIGRPGRIGALARFIDHVKQRGDVWICSRSEIARHWIARHPCGDGDAR